MAQYKLVKFTLNGKEVEKMVDVRASLTDMLRNDYHLTSVDSKRLFWADYKNFTTVGF